MAFDRAFIQSRIARSASVIAGLSEAAPLIERIGTAVRDALLDGKSVYTCGNGGSAAEALHLAEELIGRYSIDRRPWPGVCLNADPTAITCIANDFGFDAVYERQINALGRMGDVLVAFSTSGKSPNIVRALEAARSKSVITIGLLGKGGGPCARLCDHALIVDSDHTEAIQEAHQVVVHLILEAVEHAEKNPGG